MDLYYWKKDLKIYISEEKFESFWNDYQSHVFPFPILFLDFLRNNALVNDRGNEPR